MILFGIVSFREIYTESITYIDLINSFYTSSNIEKQLNIVVFDNTDSVEWKSHPDNFSEDKINIKYIHDPSNPGISFAYNKIFQVALQKDVSHIVFLDQDTHLPLNAYDSYSEMAKNSKIAAPRVWVDHELISPSKYYFFRSKKLKEIILKKLSLKNHTVINSGLLVRTDVFKSVKGYNEMLRVDFCDHDFIRRLAGHESFIDIIPIDLIQNFSTNNNNLKNAIFRYRIFVKDLLMFKKSHKNNFLITFFVDFPHLLRLSYQYKTFQFLIIRFNCFLS